MPSTLYDNQPNHFRHFRVTCIPFTNTNIDKFTDSLYYWNINKYALSCEALVTVELVINEKKTTQKYYISIVAKHYAFYLSTYIQLYFISMSDYKKRNVKCYID